MKKTFGGLQKGEEAGKRESLSLFRNVNDINYYDIKLRVRPKINKETS